MIGRTLSHYRILERIGSGGMGDVCLARDTKLDRDVALKVLPPELAESEERRARFKREAKALAALNQRFKLPAAHGQLPSRPYPSAGESPGCEPS